MLAGIRRFDIGALALRANAVRPALGEALLQAGSRALYMSIHGPPGVGWRPARTGHSMQRDELLLAIKGYPAEVVHQRESLVRQCLAPDRKVDVHAILTELAALDWPIVLHVASSSTLFESLRTRNAGRLVYARPPDVVWLVDAVTLRAAAAELSSDP